MTLILIFSVVERCSFQIAGCGRSRTTMSVMKFTAPKARLDERGGRHCMGTPQIPLRGRHIRKTPSVALRDHNIVIIPTE